MSLKFSARRRFAAVATALTSSFVPATAVIGVALVQPACFVFGSPGPSMVGQGKKYESGDPNFDQFFAQLYEVQLEMAKASAMEKDARQELIKATKSDPDASATLLAKKVEKRAKEVAEAGTGIKLSVDGLEGSATPTVELKTFGKDPSGDDKELFDALEKTAKEEAKLLGRLRDVERQLEQMRALSIALDQQVDSAFRKGGPAKKAEVRKNLEDSRTLMPLMVARAQETADAARTALKKLSDAADTEGSYKKEEPPPPPPPPEETPDAEGKPKPKPKPGPGPGTAAPPPPKPPPAQPPPDFEP